jgi:RNA polymerase sigma-70 factor (sigma-E family)
MGMDLESPAAPRAVAGLSLARERAAISAMPGSASGFAWPEPEPEPEPVMEPGREADAATAAVTALYREHALSLIRLAHIMLGNRAGAEDVVHDAFCGLYRRWEHLADKDKALGYVRSSVLNGCRTALRRGRLASLVAAYQPSAISAEAAVLSSEERREVVLALRRLPERQREVLVLRYYLDLSDEQIAADLGISPSTIRSTRHRALASLERLLGEPS